MDTCHELLNIAADASFPTILSEAPYYHRNDNLHIKNKY